jgi:hypothetical protein
MSLSLGECCTAVAASLATGKKNKEKHGGRGAT